MSVRRVVTGVVDGVSRVVADGPAPRAVAWDNLWFSGPDNPLGRDPGDDGTMEFSNGSIHWRIFDVPPEAVLRKMLEESGSEIGADGFHTTPTVDFVSVLEGHITLELEGGEEVELHPGDCVVQRATNHAWRNLGDTDVRLLTVMVGLPDADRSEG
jgi:quercetin dioxygenase-like cupin family protein